jgi:hypothetical protein
MIWFKIEKCFDVCHLVSLFCTICTNTMSSTSTLGKSLLYFWYSELILNYIGSGGLTPPKTKLCQQVMDYVKDSNGIEIQDSSGDSIPILCGAEFPDSEDGPWCIWLDLCADCYRKYRTDDMESVSQMSQTSYLSVPSKTLRVTMDGKIGTYEQFGNCGMNRIALDDGSFSVTVNSEDYLENWFPKLSFVDCNHPQCRARATTSCSNPTCAISTCSQHTQETCICAVLHDLSAASLLLLVMAASLLLLLLLLLVMAASLLLLLLLLMVMVASLLLLVMVASLLLLMVMAASLLLVVMAASLLLLTFRFWFRLCLLILWPTFSKGLKQASRKVFTC